MLERTLQSICNQTSANFKVVIVCNEIPKINFYNPHISYITVNFWPENLTLEAKTLDRGYKVRRGLEWAKKMNASHVMFVDADDCISKHLVKFITNNRDCDAWYINQGYYYKNNSDFIYLKNKLFFTQCGTCNIIKTKLYNLEIKDKNFILNYYGRHQPIIECLKMKNIQLKEFPFRGATYILENGENYYNNSYDRLIGNKNFYKKVKSLRYCRPLNTKIKDEFSLYKI
ncbi:MAG: glycosyltransferase family A protein [Mastigocoleus sp.]